MKKLLVLLVVLGAARLVPKRRPRSDEDMWPQASQAIDLR